MSTNKLHANAYEAQLTTEEREQLHTLLNQPNLSLADIQAQAPPWHSGPAAGAKPSLMALSRMAARLRTDEFISDTESHGEALLAISQQLQHDPVLSCDSSQMTDHLCRLLSQELIGDILSHRNVRYRAPQMRVLLKRQDQYLDKAKFQRDTCEILIKWYNHDQIKQTLQSDSDHATKIQEIGRTIFGDNW
jgi:hypothetical protein